MSRTRTYMMEARKGAWVVRCEGFLTESVWRGSRREIPSRVGTSATRMHMGRRAERCREEGDHTLKPSELWATSYGNEKRTHARWLFVIHTGISIVIASP